MTATPAAREVYRDVLVAMMQDEPRVWCIDTDTGLFTDVDFGRAAGRYINLGIAEQNLMGTAAGLAASGQIPFVNTMAAFAAARALEQVKIDIAYNALPVRIVATHGGLSAGHLGPTHHALEDLAIMRLLPNLRVVVPADAAQTRIAVHAIAQQPGPAYLRLGRKPTPAIPEAPFQLGVPQVLRRGDDAVVFACGGLPVHAALEAAEVLFTERIATCVVNVHTVKPLDQAAIVALARGRIVVTIEDAWRTGGLGGAIAELLAEVAPTFVHRIGVADTFSAAAGDHEFLLTRHGVTASAVADAIRKARR